MARKRGSRQGTRETSLMEHMVELLHDSPVDDGLICCDRVISHISDEIDGLKQFITNVTVNSVTNVSVKDEESDQKDESAPDNVYYNIEKIVGDLLIEAANINPILSGILHEINSWDWNVVRAIRDKIMDYAVFDWVSDIKDDVADLKRDISAVLSTRSVMSDMQKDVKIIVKRIRDFESLILELEDLTNSIKDTLTQQHAEITELEIATYQRLVSDSDDIRRLLADYHNASNVWFQTIYDKLVECCVKQDVLELLEKSDAIQSDIDYVKSRLDGAPSARQQAVEGETRSQLKAIQAQLAEIRGLL